MVDMVLLQRKLYFSKDPVGVHNFQGVQLPGWRSNFLGGGGGGGGLGGGGGSKC